MNPYNNLLNIFPQQSQGIKYVSGRASAEVYQMQPNSQEVLFDNSKDTFYFIQTDASGIKAIKECNYTIVEPEAPEDFVKRNEFEQIKSQIGRIEDILNRNKKERNNP